jgi:hypothetical protein
MDELGEGTEERSLHAASNMYDNVPKVILN